MDGYDKLTPFGIGISGCIDGYSRKIIWLKAYKTNSDPRVIASYYLDSVKEHGCPQIIRADRGTENGHVRQMQIFLRRAGQDQFAGDGSFIYGTSPLNQRIEQWWGQLRRQCIQFWMDIFHILRDFGQFTGDVLDKNLLLFCFLSIIEVSTC
jgi:hypothetical protein